MRVLQCSQSSVYIFYAKNCPILMRYTKTIETSGVHTCLSQELNVPRRKTNEHKEPYLMLLTLTLEQFKQDIQNFN